MKFFIFEVINYEEVSKGLGKPRLVERGPYVFDEKRRKEVISYTNTTLCYKQFKSFVFNADKSRGTLEDKFMMINIPAIVRNFLFFSFFQELINVNYLYHLMIGNVNHGS